MPGKMTRFCEKCGAPAMVTEGNSYTSSGPQIVCSTRPACDWTAPVPQWYLDAVERERAVDAQKPNLETEENSNE